MQNIATVEWPTADLARRVERGLDVAEAAISLVAAESASVDLDSLEAPPDKVIAETAMFLRAAFAVPATSAPGVRERADQLARALVPHARHPRVAIGLALHPAMALDYGAAHIVLRKAGHPNTLFDNALAEALAATTAGARERLPHRELEQAWLFSLVGGPPPPEELVARTALVRGIDLVTGSRDDIYALTHALLYATDFGNYRPRVMKADDDILATARSALAGALDDDDFDLAGEILLTWPFLRANWDSSSSFAFGVLARVEDEVGILPSLTLNREGYEQQPAVSRKQYVAALTYHTAYVMGLLCAVMLHLRSFPNTLPPAGTDSIDFAEELLAGLAVVERRPQWLRDFEALPSTIQAACASFLLDVALRRAVRRIDLAEVRHLLQGGIDNRIALSPLCQQVAGILHRLARFSTSGVGMAHFDMTEKL